jgi:DNA repair exonuclease SbcCD ATPase subunit
MRPLTLELWDFQAHKHSFLDFTKLDKVTLIVGEFEGEEKRSNGAGKTTLFDAIEWILFDQTRATVSRTATIEDLIRDNEKMMKGVYTFQAYDQNVYKITKTHKRRKTNPCDIVFELQNGETWQDISCDTKDDTRQKIIKALGFDKTIFTSTALLKQHEVAGIASEDSDARLTLVKKILKLDKWALCAQNAKTRADSLKLKLTLDSKILLEAQAAKIEKNRKLLQKRELSTS